MMGKKESSSSSSFHRHNLSSSSSSSTRTTTRRSMSPSSSSSMPAQNAIRSSTSSTTSSRSSSKSSSRRVVGGSIITMCVIGIILSVTSSLSSSSLSSFSSLSSLSTLSLLSFWTATIKNTNEEGQASAASSIITSNSNSNTISNNNNNNNLIPLPQKAVQAEAQAEQVQIQKAEVQEGEVQEVQEAVSVLNIHVVPHSHDDVGWLKTIDQYYYGLNNTIQDVSVQNILTSVIQSLLENPKRTFTYVEMKFFTLWYNQQSLDLQQQVYHLIHSTKQLNFVNGGWCMHDEGTTHYIGMIDQTTLGHTFLRQELNVIPTIGWQLDPFGHSKTQASLLTYKMGMNALYFGRIDYQDLSIRQLTKECEGLWNFNMKDDPSKTSADDNSSIFWGLTGSYNGNYGPPGNFCFDIHCGKGYIPLIDMKHQQLIQHITTFLLSVREQSERTAEKSNNIMITMGEDFQYQNASINYANLDLLINTIMQNNTDIDIPSIFGPQYNQINIFYSSPEYYTQCKYNETSSKVKSVKSKSKSSVESKSELKKEIRTSSNRGTSSSGSGGVVLVATEEEVDLDDGTVNEFNNNKNKNNRLRRAATTTKPHDVKVDDDNDDDDDDDDEDGDDVGSGSRDDGGGVEWTTKYDDFFPYSDCPNCFWTGYFTSRPSLKKFERIGSSFILASRQILSSRTSISTSSLTNPTVSNTCTDQMYLLDDAHGVLQHHDGVSGTSKQHVAYDYAKRLQEGIDGVVPCLIHKLKDQFLGGNSSSNDNDNDDNNDNKYLKDLTYCQLLNETICDISTSSTSSNSSNTDLYVIVYNSLASERSTVIDLPVGSSGKYIIVDSFVVLEDEDEDQDESDDDEQHTYKQTIEAQQRPFILSRSNSVDNNDNDDDSVNDSSFVLSFMADSLPPVGAKVFRIRKQTESELLVDKKDQQQIKGNNNSNNIIRDDDDDLTEIFNGRFTVAVNTKTGNIHRIGSHDLFKQQQQQQQQEGQKGQNKNNLIAGLSAWGYYTSFDSNGTSSQNSGAYIFRPSTPNQKLHFIPVTNTTVVNNIADSGGGGHGGIEIHTKYEVPWIQTITRICKDVPYIEVEYQVGPIPVNDGVGKEIVTRYNTNVDNDATFYTDSNGREFMKRQRNHRPTWDLSVYEPVAGNYYPVNTAIYVERKQQGQRNDEPSSPSRSAAFAVVTDRTQGGSSILDYTVELMVHRRTLVDDGRGVGEPINETDIGITSCPPYGNTNRIGEGLIIRGKHRIIVVDEKRETTISATTTTNTTTEVGNKSNDFDDSFGAQLARSEMDASFAEPLVFVGTAPSSEETPFRVKSFSGLKKSLPHNIMLITKQLLCDDNDEKEEEQEKESTPTSTSTFLVRLGHQYAIGEDIVLSLPVNIDLSIIFPGQSIKDIQETTLSGNRDIEDWRNERFDWTGTGTGETDKKNDDVSSESYTITLTPMDIRTFKIQIK